MCCVLYWEKPCLIICFFGNWNKKIIMNCHTPVYILGKSPIQWVSSSTDFEIAAWFEKINFQFEIDLTFVEVSCGRCLPSFFFSNQEMICGRHAILKFGKVRWLFEKSFFYSLLYTIESNIIWSRNWTIFETMIKW